jgi:hypothetical protein
MTYVGFWDVRQSDWFANERMREARTRWLSENDLPLTQIYRCEFWAEPSGPIVRIFAYHLDDKGHRHWTPGHLPDVEHDHSQCGAAVLPAWDIAVEKLPPAYLM